MGFHVIAGSPEKAPDFCFNHSGHQPWGGKSIDQMSTLDIWRIREFVETEGFSQGFNSRRNGNAYWNPFDPRFFFGEPHRFWKLAFEIGLSSENGTRTGRIRDADPVHAHLMGLTVRALSDLGDMVEAMGYSSYCSFVAELLIEWLLDYDNIFINILSNRPAPAPDLPSHLFPGCGSGGAEFKVLGPNFPPRSDLDKMLYETFVDASLTDYDERTGLGYFVIIDGDAPDAGLTLKLDNPFLDNPFLGDE